MWVQIFTNARIGINNDLFTFLRKTIVGNHNPINPTALKNRHHYVFYDGIPTNKRANTLKGPRNWNKISEWPRSCIHTEYIYAQNWSISYWKRKDKRCSVSSDSESGNELLPFFIKFKILHKSVDKIESLFLTPRSLLPTHMNSCPRSSFLWPIIQKAKSSLIFYQFLEDKWHTLSGISEYSLFYSSCTPQKKIY